jgi:type IV pilus assembly protein PilB
MTSGPKKKPIGAVLVDHGFISQDQLRIALLEQKKTGDLLGKVLISLGFITDAVIRDVLSENIGQTSVDLTHLVIDAETLRMVPQEMARRHTMIPVSLDKERARLTLAMADTFNVVALDQVRALHNGAIRVDPVLAGEADIQRAIEQFYGFELSIDGILAEIETGEIDFQSLQLGKEEYSHPMVRLIDALLADAVKLGASDVHFEPETAFVRIRYRIDGVLRQIRSLHRMYWPAMVVRLKIITGMNIAETRASQDGRTSMTLAGRPVDFRAAAQPTTHGENIVLRILDRQKGIVSLENLGLHEDSLQLLKLIIARPVGIILVTGPTGSGKTTTLYSIMNYINKESVNIMTMEDPVEYPMPMIRQTSVNESVKMGFAEGIRSMLRQDPDIILIGEIRDVETSEMAFRAAMTGHQVYSTLHTNSAVGAISRLLDIGVSSELMADNIIGIVAQRLVRRLCPRCRKPYSPGDLECTLLGPSMAQKGLVLYEAQGCEACNHQGYKGRTCIMELLRINTDMSELIARRATSRELLAAALANGFRTLADEGSRRVIDGTTSLDEVTRVVDLTERLDK